MQDPNGFIKPNQVKKELEKLKERVERIEKQLENQKIRINTVEHNGQTRIVLEKSFQTWYSPSYLAEILKNQGYHVEEKQGVNDQ
jgi:SMC interacting uncharacterized protein involved in chromosome segregation